MEYDMKFAATRCTECQIATEPGGGEGWVGTRPGENRMGYIAIFESAYV